MSPGGIAFLALGCALGGISRFWLSGLVGRHAGELFPWGTLAVNVTGSFGIGLVASTIAAAGDAWFTHPRIWNFAVIGFLGSYTTVSSFSFQTLALVRNGQLRLAAGNLALSLGLCLAGAAAGVLAGGGWAASQ